MNLGLREFGQLQQRGRGAGITHAGDDDVGSVGRIELDEFETDPAGGSGDYNRGRLRVSGGCMSGLGVLESILTEVDGRVGHDAFESR